MAKSIPTVKKFTAAEKSKAKSAGMKGREPKKPKANASRSDLIDYIERYNRYVDRIKSWCAKVDAKKKAAEARKKKKEETDKLRDKIKNI